MKLNKTEVVAKKSLALHKKYKGKINIVPSFPITSSKELILAYTPGVGAVSSFLSKNKDKIGEYTIQGRTVAVISDGSAVLGLGNIGPEGALPVMEGKSALFKTFANIDSFPIVLNTQDTEKIIETIIAISPVFGGINLEDIAAPKCFEIEERLQKALSIPVVHDDQHSTAIVVLAGIINALKVVRKKIENVTVVINGAGAAGTAIAKLLHKANIGNILVVDTGGIISKKRKDLSPHKKQLSLITNRNQIQGLFVDAISGADIVVGVSGPGTIQISDITKMAHDPIVFALANPVPEIMPDDAKKGGARVIATGRSDFPNQVNNVLVFPGMFRGALDNKVKLITDDMKIQAAHNLAGLVKKPTSENIIPKLFNKEVVRAVAKAMR